MRANSFVFPLKRLEFFVALVDLLPVFPENCFPVTGKLAGKRETHPGNGKLTRETSGKWKVNLKLSTLFHAKPKFLRRVWG
jgi:hypothetical protein